MTIHGPVNVKNPHYLSVQCCQTYDILTNRVLCIIEAEMKDRSDDSNKQVVVMRNAVATSRKNNTSVRYIVPRVAVLFM
jgi:hypothetical protein